MKKSPSQKNLLGIPFSGIMVIMTLFVSVIALIPAFLSLNKEKAVVYYSYVISHYEAPDGISKTVFEDFLKKNNVAANKLSIQLMNCGNAPSKEVGIYVSIKGDIVRYDFEPSWEEESIWVDVPQDADLIIGRCEKLTKTVKNLGTNKLLLYNISYEEESSQLPEIEVFADGVGGSYISNISNAPKWNPYRVFYLPGYILGGGLALLLLYVVVFVILSNPEYKKLLLDIGESTLKGVYLSIFPAQTFHSAIQTFFKQAAEKDTDKKN